MHVNMQRLDKDLNLQALWLEWKSFSPLLQALLSELNEVEISHDLNIWFERIPSASNPADVPSRGDIKHLPINFRVRLNPCSLLHATCMSGGSSTPHAG